MSHQSRRGGPSPGPQSYAAVPTSPRSGIQQQRASHISGPRPPMRSSSVSSKKQKMHSGRGAIAMGVASGSIGAGYGPYSVRLCVVLTAASLAKQPFYAVQPEPRGLQPIPVQQCPLRSIIDNRWRKGGASEHIIHATLSLGQGS